MTDTIESLRAEVLELQAALENCRLFAARHRKEDWAKQVLIYCADAGISGSPLRTKPDTSALEAYVTAVNPRPKER